MNDQAPQGTFDVVVIGGGIGGLTAGALLAQAGKKVVVVEHEERPGGYARELQRGAYNINPSLHLIMGCNQTSSIGQGVIDEVLRHLGVRDQCDFVAADPFYRVQFPDFQMDVPTGRDAYLEAHRQLFPGEASGLNDLVNLCSQIFRETMDFPIVPRWRDWALMPIRFPGLFRHANATLGSVIDKYLSDPRQKSAYAIVWPYLGLPPSRVSFLAWATMMASYVEQGAFFCRGGFQSLADALAQGLTNHGGELILGMRVSKILASNNHVQGIVMENGQEILAPVVISNIDARITFQELLESDQVPSRYLRKLDRSEPSVSVLGLYLATDLDVSGLGIPKVTFISPWDLDGAYTTALMGQVSALAMHIPTVADASLAPPGEHLVILQAFVSSKAADLSPAASSQFAENLLGQAERVLPGLREHITFVEGSTEGQQEYPLQRLGPIYGWADSPQQHGPRRLPNKSPLSGLYLAGHWTQPGHGIWTVVLSGINSARMVLGKNTSDAIWPLRF